MQQSSKLLLIGLFFQFLMLEATHRVDCVREKAGIGAFSVLVAELWTIQEGLHHAWRLDNQKVELESAATKISILAGLTLQSQALVTKLLELLDRHWEVEIHLV
ncbi:hypothetical protein V6N11_071227 [Hibiscus sabdariffa]|uniref:RNase H type-1 domain-containing protein n=1 Tax=Hibiscus sabdariffa TaxID=183260 RepID=A0ABR2TZQ9_9ROSI